MKVGIVGSRSLTALTPEDMLPYVPANCSQIISGGAQGADEVAKKTAQLLGIELLEILPNYHKYGKSAPLKRNQQIAETCNYLLAFWDGRSRGTQSIIDYCIRCGIPFRVIPCENFLVSAIES